MVQMSSKWQGEPLPETAAQENYSSDYDLKLLKSCVKSKILSGSKAKYNIMITREQGWKVFTIGS